MIFSFDDIADKSRVSMTDALFTTVVSFKKQNQIWVKTNILLRTQVQNKEKHFMHLREINKEE